MKRIFCALLALVLIAGLSGCKKDAAETEPILESSEALTEETAEETTEETEEPTEEETEQTQEPTETTEETVPSCENHSWGYWVQWEAPTSSAEGKRVRTCTVCGAEDVQTIAKLPKSTHKHTYKTETSKSTCKEAGWVYYYCTCGDWYQVDEPAKDHTWGDWKITKGATKKADGTTTDGIWTRTCKKCKETETKTVKYCADDKHDYGDAKKVAKTCKTTEYTYKTCKTCGFRYRYNFGKAYAEHKWGKWEVVTPATASAEGEEKRVCSVCKKVETQSIPKPAHDCTKSMRQETITPATCTEEGKGQWICAVPGCTTKGEEFTIPVLGHDWSEWTESTEDPAKETRTCSRCQTTETRDKAEPGETSASTEAEEGT